MGQITDDRGDCRGSLAVVSSPRVRREGWGKGRETFVSTTDASAPRPGDLAQAGKVSRNHVMAGRAKRRRSSNGQARPYVQRIIMTQRTIPPFRADHVGSLLRTGALKAAREKRARNEIDAEAFKTIEDREIAGVIAKQEAAGLQSITDGEYRRVSWNIDFLERLDNVESYAGERKIKFQTSGPQPRQVLLRLTGKLGGYKPHPMIEHFKFLRTRTKRTPKMTIPSPSSLHFRYGRDAVPESIYPAMEDFYRDLGQAYRKVVHAFVDAGCRYLQLDEVNLAYLCDPSLRKIIADRGEDPARLPATYAGMINAAIADIPSDMTITMHLCRGNFRSNFVASGGYEPVAELFFNTINVHGYFMEYDTARA